MYRSASSIASVSVIRMDVWLDNLCFFNGAVTIPCLVLEASVKILW